MDKTADQIENLLTSEQKDLITKAATLEGKSVSDFIITSAHHMAKHVLKEQELVTLTKRDREVFIEALLSDDSHPNEKLMKAAQEYKITMGIK